MSLKTVRQWKNECSVVLYHPHSVSAASQSVACVQHYALHLLDVFRRTLKQDTLLIAWRLSVYFLAVIWYLHLICCMCNNSFVYSLQYTSECGCFHLTVMITAFHGTLPCFIVMVMPCIGNAHADYTHLITNKKLLTSLLLNILQYYIARILF